MIVKKISPANDNEYKGKLETKQWCTLTDAQGLEYRVWVTHPHGFCYSEADLGKDVQMELSAPKTPKNGGDPYYLGRPQSAPQASAAYGQRPPLMGNQPALRVSMKDMSGSAINASAPIKSDRESSIEKQVCLKCAVELAVAGKIAVDDIVVRAKALYTMFSLEQPAPEPVEQKEQPPLQDDFVDDIPF